MLFFPVSFPFYFAFVWCFFFHLEFWRQTEQPRQQMKRTLDSLFSLSLFSIYVVVVAVYFTILSKIHLSLCRFLDKNRKRKERKTCEKISPGRFGARAMTNKNAHQFLLLRFFCLTKTILNVCELDTFLSIFR